MIKQGGSRVDKAPGKQGRVVRVLDLDGLGPLALYTYVLIGHDYRPRKGKTELGHWDSFWVENENKGIRHPTRRWAARWGLNRPCHSTGIDSHAFSLARDRQRS